MDIDEPVPEIAYDAFQDDVQSLLNMNQNENKAEASQIQILKADFSDVASV